MRGRAVCGLGVSQEREKRVVFTFLTAASAALTAVLLPRILSRPSSLIVMSVAPVSSWICRTTGEVRRGGAVQGGM